jgi:replication factor A1
MGDPITIVPPQSSAETNVASTTASASTASTAKQPDPQPPQKPRVSVYPIEGLSPYQNNWTIRARVTQKSEIRNWSNQRGEGKLFNVTLMDESAEIRGTGFNNVVDDLYDKFEEGKVYYISKARVNLAKKKFSNLQNDYELTFDRNTEVEEVSFDILTCER